MYILSCVCGGLFESLIVCATLSLTLVLKGLKWRL